MNNLNLLISALGRNEWTLINSLGKNLGANAGVVRHVGPLGDRIYYSLLNDGIQLIFKEDKLEQITFYMQPREGFDSYDGALPAGLSKEMHYDEVIGLLGLPGANGGGNNDPLLGRISRWVKYESLRPQIHIEFDLKGGIEKISLS
ncbi:hypothetical protein LN461_20140 [Xanthomonas arboricola]|uniref:hypothetical protein n=1 Tax=Xanthomonas arboricola TaxID=56448 RepID=UPI001E59F1D2|nr:hypothetical protein [Xanthomonas arboricola]MCC8671644.1 hypothetical protein [Xanthomonas arboricola]